jgi:hypothetical protein
MIFFKTCFKAWKSHRVWVFHDCMNKVCIQVVRIPRIHVRRHGKSTLTKRLAFLNQSLYLWTCKTRFWTHFPLSPLWFPLLKSWHTRHAVLSLILGQSLIPRRVWILYPLYNCTRLCLIHLNGLKNKLEKSFLSSSNGTLNFLVNRGPLDLYSFYFYSHDR